jgi:hypothetical protein
MVSQKWKRVGVPNGDNAISGRYAMKYLLFARCGVFCGDFEFQGAFFWYHWSKGAKIG